MLKKVLYIHHVGLIGGSSRSLYELISAFPHGHIDAHIICPPGKLSQALLEKNVKHIPCVGVPIFDNCSYSFYRGFRWLILFREFALVLPFTLSCLRAKKQWKHFDIIHVNDIPLLPAAWIAHRLFPNSKVVMHARAVQATTPNLRTRTFYKILKTFVDKVVAISLHVFKSLPQDLPAEIIHNGLKPPKDLPTKMDRKRMNVGMVGMISKSKGCDTFIEAARICKESNLDIQFLLIGESIGKSGFTAKVLKLFGLREDLGKELRQLVNQYSLQNNVVFLPFNPNLTEVYSQLDVLCFPSLLDAPGRPIFEAAFFSLPSIVAISKPESDTFIDGKTGFAISPNNPAELAEKIKRLSDDAALRKVMGENAKQMAEANFDSLKNSLRILEIYTKLLR